jgi:hypothetical protein
MKNFTLWQYKMELSIFSPPGTYFSKCFNCGNPCIKFIGEEPGNCIWCNVNFDEDVRNEDQ